MQDESLIDEMRAALKGDRERAEIRRRTTRPPEPAAAPAVSADPTPESPALTESAAPRGVLVRLGLRKSKTA